MICISGLTQQEKCILAAREREKGNEAFRTRDWDEAIVYYTRSDLIFTLRGTGLVSGRSYCYPPSKMCERLIK